jgi:molecular chaperone DnaK (HSP70)
MLTDSTAVALYYSITKEVLNQKTVLVYYLGAGQVSVSLMILNSGGRIETKAASGNR